MYWHRWAVLPPLCSCSSEREKKLSNRLAASSTFLNFRPVDLKSPTDLSDIPTDLTDLWVDLWSLASHALPGGRVKYANEKQLQWLGQWPSTCKKHPGQWPSTCKNPLIGKELAVLYVCRHRESHRREAAVSCSLYYIDRVCLHEPSFTTDLTKSSNKSLEEVKSSSINSPVSIGKPAPKIQKWTIYFVRRWGFGWVNKVQSFRLARRFGAACSSPDFSRAFHDMALLGLCFEFS